jgi:glycosyltransferase involved in cell wall biosynthesis
MEKVSVVIPTYNRFKYLINAIKSIKEQTYGNIEIIVVNDCSTQSEYYSFDFKSIHHDIHVIHLPKNSRNIHGKVCGGGNARNIGMMMSSGKYIAFLDDDDYFIPSKIEKQINAIKKYNCDISCTEALYGFGAYCPNSKYNTWHYKGVYWNTLISIFTKQNKLEYLEQMYKDEINIWNEEHILLHNCTCGGSSIVMKADLIAKTGYFPLMEFAEDWEYWKKIIRYSNCIFLREPLTYIDNGHGDGQLYK